MGVYLSETDGPITISRDQCHPIGQGALYLIKPHDKQILAELETEMAIAQEALKTMMEQRNDTHALLAPLSSAVDAGGSKKQVSNASVTDRSETCDEIKPEIEEGQLELRRLLEQRKDISEQLDLHRDQLSPICKVPPEIIRILFLLWASDRHFLRSPTYVSPNVLTGVSGRILHSVCPNYGP